MSSEGRQPDQAANSSNMQSQAPQNQARMNPAIPPGQGQQAQHPAPGVPPQQQQQQQQQQQRPRGQLLSIEELNRIVLEFLNKKGYARTEAMLRLESSRTLTPASSDGSVQTGVLPLPAAATGPAAYPRALMALSDWVSSSLDLYRPELYRVMYPVFVYMFLDLLSNGHLEEAKSFFETFSKEFETFHELELRQLSGLSLAQHIKENELAQKFKNNKYRVLLSRTSLDLLLYFLNSIETMGGVIVIRIINQHFELAITDRHPSNLMADEDEDIIDPSGLVPRHDVTNGKQGEQASSNSANVKLGPLPRGREFQDDVVNALGQKDKTQAEATELVEKYKASISAPNTDSPLPDAIPLPKYKVADVKAMAQKIVDFDMRIELGTPQAPYPSVCMYTFHNTRDEMTCLEFNEDITLAAGGFADSYVQLWSLKNEKLQSVIKDEHTTSSSRRLVGHSGSVYGLSFAPDNRTLLSCSEDKTVRLWSMDTYTALVSYKGHMDAVWDVKYAPFGHYFATASHDQTARLWSTDHIYPLRVFSGHMSDVDNVAFHPNGTYLFTGSSDKTIRMWDISQGSSVRVFIGHVGAVTALAVSPDGRWLASAGEDGMINIWDIGTGRRLKSMRDGGRGTVYSLAFSQEGSILISGGANNSVHVWDVKKNTPLAGPEPEKLVAEPASSTQRRKKDNSATTDHMTAYFTKRTPIYNVKFTQRNLAIAGGAFLG